MEAKGQCVQVDDDDRLIEKSRQGVWSFLVSDNNNKVCGILMAGAM